MYANRYRPVNCLVRHTLNGQESVAKHGIGATDPRL